MSDLNDGGTAFPAEGPSAGQFENPGMTLRQWYAGQALAGMMANIGVVNMLRDKSEPGLKETGWACMTVADALIAAEAAEGDGV